MLIGSDIECGTAYLEFLFFSGTRRLRFNFLIEAPERKKEEEGDDDDEREKKGGKIIENN